MTKQPWMKWYPSDWRGDPLVRACDPLTRYVWFEMLGLMHEAEPYGHLVIGGRALDYKTLARVIAVDAGEVKRAVKELTDRGVCNRTDDGILFSRRMVRDQKKRENLAENGSKGGKKTQNKTRVSSEQNQEDNGILLKQTLEQSDKQNTKPQKPEARGQRPEASKLASERAPPEDDGLKLRLALVDVFKAHGRHIPPAMGREAVWLAQGYSAELCLAVVKSKMPGAADKGLPWFDKAIAEAAAVRPGKAHALAPAEPKISIGYGSVAMPESNLRRCIERWISDPESWSLSAWGPYPPENPVIVKFATERGIELKHVEAAE